MDPVAGGEIPHEMRDEPELSELPPGNRKLSGPGLVEASPL